MSVFKTTLRSRIAFGSAFVCTIGSLLLVSCDGADQTSPLQVSVDNSPASAVAVSGAAAYAKVRANPNSQGQMHNALLDEGLRAIKEYRAKNGNGRRVRYSVACRIFTDAMAPKMDPRAAIAVAQVTKRLFPATRDGSKGCDETLVRGTKGLPNSFSPPQANKATSPHFASSQADSAYDAWFDQEWDSDWTAYTDDVTVNDDLAMISEWETSISSVIYSASTVSDISNGVSSLMSNSTFADDISAGLIAEAAGLAVSSAEYWDANFDTWLDEMCDGEIPADISASANFAHNRSSEFCDEGEGEVIRASYLVDGLSSDQKTIIAADLGSALGIVGDVVNGIKAGHQLWEDGAYLLKGKQNVNARNIIRALRPSSGALMRSMAGGLIRSNLVSNLAMSAAGSGLAWWAVN